MSNPKRYARNFTQSKHQKVSTTPRQVVYTEVPDEMRQPERLNRLTALLSEALSRHLGQTNSAER
jgi:hypothetical protein